MFSVCTGHNVLHEPGLYGIRLQGNPLLLPTLLLPLYRCSGVAAAAAAAAERRQQFCMRLSFQASIRKAPFISWPARFLRCIFVDRDSEQDRRAAAAAAADAATADADAADAEKGQICCCCWRWCRRKALEALVERMKIGGSDPTCNPIVVFPEGPKP